MSEQVAVIRPVIDLRSDTVTKPTTAMRAAMASAEVGDDVYGEDPTVRALEARAAEMLGKEAAIFVPTGSMGNQIALKLHTQPGQEVLCEARSHVLDWEMGTMASFSGCMPRTVEGERGVMRWSQLASKIAPKGLYYRAQTGLIWLENTHNMAGGVATPLAVLEEIWAGAQQTGLPVHLDGARVFNAAVTLGEDVATITRGFDTVMFCLSKGLGAPVGSVLVGAQAHIDRARPIRKALGGGMRQAGILAAAGLVALETMPQLLHVDHANATSMAVALAAEPGLEVDLESVQSNMVFFRLTKGDARELVARMAAKGVLASAIGPELVRLVTHRDVSAEECEAAVTVVTKEFRSLTAI